MGFLLLMLQLQIHILYRLRTCLYNSEQLSSKDGSSDERLRQERQPREAPPLLPPHPPTKSREEPFRSIDIPPYPIPMSTEPPQPFSLENQEYFLKWDHAYLYDSRVEWRIELDLKLVKATILSVLECLGISQNNVEVEFRIEGGYNKIYTVKTGDVESSKIMEYIFRVSMPIDPYYKTEADVATTELVRHFTNIPVPVIYAYDSSTRNPLGLEWMLMEKVEGKELADGWKEMNDEEHIRTIRKVADWANELSNLKSDKIGSTYLRWTDSKLEFFIGPSTNYRFCKYRRLLYNVHRGPFSSTADFYDAMLDVQQQELDDPFYIDLLNSGFVQDESGDNNYDQKTKEEKLIYDDFILKRYGPQTRWGKKTRPALTALKLAMPEFRYHLDTLGLETTIIHEDLSFYNIFIDKDANLIALLDWEYVQFLPLIHSSTYPGLFDSDDVEERFQEVYKERLKELSSPLLICFREGQFFETNLLDRVIDVEKHDNRTIKWVAAHLRD